MVGAIASGRTQTEVASSFGIHRDTVRKLVNSVRDEVPQDQWRSRLTNDLVPKSVDALDASVSDRNDVHKAAHTGMGILKGLGILDGDTPGTVINVLTVVNQALPSDLQFDIVSTDEVIDAQAVESTQEIE